ncbi:HEPN domain-containing protein [Kitasatospora sp. NPDC059146]|uniref:HEPN domain-containing protein n=1 Tax=Kitasatospora sp. NPDC059146 TaxID=3346741 RepID=UPI003679A4F0
MTSSRFQELEKRIGELTEYFLPKSFDPIGLYDEIIYEQARAFKVLAHAEFESFIEDRVIEVVDGAVARWEQQGKISQALLAAVAYRELAPLIPASLNEAATKREKFPTLKARVQAARNDINRYVRNQNHGIKEKNLLRMLLPIGFSDDEINPDWLAVTEAWATTRGDAAHKGAKMQVQIDPQKELKTVNEVLQGFREIDSQMDLK